MMVLVVFGSSFPSSTVEKKQTKKTLSDVSEKTQKTLDLGLLEKKLSGSVHGFERVLSMVSSTKQQFLLDFFSEKR